MILVNFGGPRHLEEIEPFLTALLQDKDVIRTRMPAFIHNWFFGRVARKRARNIRHDYELIGGKSPIYDDTEKLAQLLSEKLSQPVLTFHRYLPSTHRESFAKINAHPGELRVLPLFPQFSYATTGSIARLFADQPFSHRLRWIQSYPAHPAFVRAFVQRIQSHPADILLFSAHGVPRSFVDTGDLYESEVIRSFNAISEAFPQALCRLSYQSKFGRGEWLCPYTDEVCEDILSWNQSRKRIVVVPLSFTSDHIETLFEIEHLYLPILRKKGMIASRCPALNLESYWVDALAEIANSHTLNATSMLVRK